MSYIYNVPATVVGFKLDGSSSHANLDGYTRDDSKHYIGRKESTKNFGCAFFLPDAYHKALAAFYDEDPALINRIRLIISWDDWYGSGAILPYYGPKTNSSWNDLEISSSASTSFRSASGQFSYDLYLSGATYPSSGSWGVGSSSQYYRYIKNVEGSFSISVERAITPGKSIHGKICVGNDWKTIAGGKIFISGQWKDVKRVKVMKGGEWK